MDSKAWGLFITACCLQLGAPACRKLVTEKHQAIKFEYAKSREEIGRVFWGQAVEKPQCQAKEFVLDSVVSRESLEAVE